MHTFDISSQVQGVDDLCDGVVMAQVLNQMYDARYYINDYVIMMNAHDRTLKEIYKQCDCMDQLKLEYNFEFNCLYAVSGWLLY